MYKKLRRGRKTSFWGNRTYVRVILPTSIFAEPLPAFPTLPPGLFSDGDDGVWFDSPEGIDKSLILISVTNPSSGTDPETTWWDVVPGTLERTEYGSYTWWSAEKFTRPSVDEKFGRDGESYEEPWVFDYIALERWKVKAREDFSHPVLKKLIVCENWAKSRYTNVLPSGEVEFIFGVKGHYRNRMVRFAAGLSRSVKLAKKLGIPMKVRFI